MGGGVYLFPIQKHALMEQVAHQLIVMRSILDLGRSLKVDPRGCFRQFFSSMKVKKKKKSQTRLPLRFGLSGDVAPACVTERRSAEPGGVESHGWMRMVEAREELEEQEKQKRLGPGGLDPVEVYKSLPGVNVIYSMTRHHVKI